MAPSPTPHLLERFSVSCNRLTEGCLFGLGLSMAVIVIAQVFSRYALNHSLFWSEEIARFLLIWLTFLGAASAYRRGMHPGIDILYRRMSAASKRRSRLAVLALSLGFFVLMIWFGSQFAYFVRQQTTPALGLPKWLVFSAVPISGLIMTIHAAAFLHRDIRSDRGRP